MNIKRPLLPGVGAHPKIHGDGRRAAQKKTKGRNDVSGVSLSRDTFGGRRKWIA